mmetsp:Transcript_11020/g.15503  ORF Transcript_11020/g.15503 Transcript_11020/m.15503 type:complete len:216 (+) Transcript_11020:128-775(+)
MSDTEQAIAQLTNEINRLNLRVRRLEAERENFGRNIRPREHNQQEPNQPFVVGERVRINSNTGGLRGHVGVNFITYEGANFYQAQEGNNCSKVSDKYIETHSTRAMSASTRSQSRQTGTGNAGQNNPAGNQGNAGSAGVGGQGMTGTDPPRGRSANPSVGASQRSRSAGATQGHQKQIPKEPPQGPAQDPQHKGHQQVEMLLLLPPRHSQQPKES